MLMPSLFFPLKKKKKKKRQDTIDYTPLEKAPELLIPLKENNFSAEANVLKQVRGRVPAHWEAGLERSLRHRTYSPVTNTVYSCAMGARMFGSASICV